MGSLSIGRVGWGICLASVVLATRASAADNGGTEQVARAVTPSVVEVEAAGDWGSATASGFVVGDGSLLVTAHHAVAEKRWVRVHLDDGSTADALRVVAMDPAHDLALLQLARSLPPLVVRADSPPPGSPVMAVGSPQALGLAFTDGIVSRMHELDGIRVVQHSAPISPGNSGGPLLDREGCSSA